MNSSFPGKTISKQHLVYHVPFNKNISFLWPNKISGEKNARLLIWIFISLYLIKTRVVLSAWCLIGWPYCSLQPSFDNVIKDLTSHLYFYQITPHDDTACPKISLHTGSSSEYRQLCYSQQNYLEICKFFLSFQRAFCDPYYAFETLRQRARKRFNLLTIATDLL